MPKSFPHARPTDRRWQLYLSRRTTARITERNGLLTGWSYPLGAQWPGVFFLNADARDILFKWAPARGWRVNFLSQENALSTESNFRRAMAGSKLVNNNSSQSVDPNPQRWYNNNNQGSSKMTMQFPAPAPVNYAPQRLDYVLARYQDIADCAEGILGELAPAARSTLCKFLLADMVAVFGTDLLSQMIRNPIQRLAALVGPDATQSQACTASLGRGASPSSPVEARPSSSPTHSQKLLEQL